MRKILISIVLIVLIIGFSYIAVEGVESINIIGVKDIIEKNAEIDDKNKELADLISIKYVNDNDNLDKTATKLEETRNEYEELVLLNASTSAPGYATQTDKYEIDYLWTRLGNFAAENSVVIKIELTKNDRSNELYDLNFRVTGSYVGITDFIYAIENDSKLGFKIENFEMADAGDSKIEGKFSCKGIGIDVGELDARTQEETNTNSTNTNSTNTTNSTKTTNSTATNDTTNSSDTNTNDAS